MLRKRSSTGELTVTGARIQIVGESKKVRKTKFNLEFSYCACCPPLKDPSCIPSTFF
jgi:hypothetical protein